MYRLYSRVGYMLARRKPLFPFSIVRTGEEKVLHLRANTRSNIDCGEIARSLGGDGDKTSATLPLGNDQNLDELTNWRREAR